MAFKETLLLVLAVVSYTNAFYTFLPDGKEMVYHYHSTTKAGTHLPKFYASGFVLDGKLHIQTDKNSSFMHFTDLKYKMANGESNEWHEIDTTELPVPEEMKYLYKTFRVMYDVNGHALGLGVEHDEPIFATNIKRAMASILQIDVEELKLDTNKPYGFTTDEMTLYGKGKFHYDVQPKGNCWRVHKMLEMSSNKHMFNHMMTNMKPDPCGCTADQALTHDSHRYYTIVKKDGHEVMENMEANGGMYYHPNKGNSFAHYIWINQTFNLLTIDDVKTPMKLEKEVFYKNLDYYWGDLPEHAPPDITNGRRHVDMEKLVPKVEAMIHESITYLKGDHMNTNPIDIAKGQLINRCIRLMIHLNIGSLEKLHEKLLTDKEALHMYYQLLPLIGTQCSMNHIKNLIKQKKVKDDTAMHMLQYMPFYTKIPSTKLLTEMEDLMNLSEEFSWEIRKAGILCFSNLISMAVDRHAHMSTDTEYFELYKEAYEVYPDAKHCEKYVLEFMKRLKATTEYDIQMLFIQALHNTGIESVMEHLMPGVTGEWWKDSYLRIMSAIAISPTVLKSEDKTFEIYWPLMTDTSLPLTLRMAAFYLIMEAQPTISRLENIFSYMQDVESAEMYEFYYKYLVSMSKTTDPCKHRFAKDINAILRYTLKPEYHSVNGYYQIDYKDTKYGYGNIFSMLALSTPEHDTILKFSMSKTSNSVTRTPYQIVLRVVGLEKSLLHDLQLQLKDATNLFNVREILKTFSHLSENKDFKMCLCVTHFEKIVMTYHYDHSNIKDFKMYTLLEQQFNHVKKYLKIHYAISMTVFFPTEMGFPGVYQRYSPELSFMDYKISKDTKNSIATYHVDAKWKSWNHGRVGLTFYNPVGDVWQGVNRYHSIDAVLPINMDISVNHQQQSIKFSMRRHENSEDNVIGMRSHVTTMVLVKDDLHHGVLQKSCPTCQDFEIVSRGKDRKRNATLLDKEHANTGYHYQMTTYDSEEYIHEGFLSSMFKMIPKHTSMNYRTGFGFGALMLHSMIKALVVQAPLNHNGFLLKMEPSKQYPISNIDLTIRWNAAYTHNEEMVLRPGVEWNFRATCALKNNEKSVKTWDMTFNMNLNKGHTERTTKMHLTRLIPGQKDYRICIDGKKEWSETGSEGTLDFAMTQSGESTCKKEEIVLKIKSHGELLEEQKENKHSYLSCDERLWSDMHERQMFTCYSDHSSIRKYTYDIKTRELPTEFKKTFLHWFDHCRSYYLPYFHTDDPTGEFDDHSMKMIVEYPVNSRRMDVKMMTATHDYTFSGIPLRSEHRLVLKPENLHYSYLMRTMHEYGLTNYCMIDKTYVENINGVVVDTKMPTEWTMYVGDAEEDCKHGVWVKDIEGTDKIAVRVLHGANSMEIIPTGTTYKVTVNGADISKMPHTENWFHMNFLEDSKMHAVMLHHPGTHMLYDGHHVQIEVPQMDMKFHGKCST